MAITDTLADIRKMRRSVALRGESDPVVVANALETILKEAVMVQGMDSGGRLGKAAVNEIKNLRSDLVAGQIDAGGKTSQIMGQFSLVLDQFENAAAEDSGESEITANSALGSIASAIPSADTLTAAMITANPMLGYGTKIVSDMFKSGKVRKEQQRRLVATRLKLLEDEKKAVEEREAAEGIPEEESQHNKALLEFYDRQINVLEQIHGDIHTLRMIWEDGSDDNVKPTAVESELIQETSDTNEILERVAVEAEEQNQLQREQMQSDEYDRLKRDTDPEAVATGGAVGAAAEDAESSGMFDFLPAGIASLSTFLAPLGAMFKTVLKIGKGILKFGGITTALFAVFDAVDGFFSASDILGKEDVSIVERLRVAHASIITGLLEPVDALLGLFDVDLFGEGGKDELTKKIAEFDILQMVTDIGDLAAEIITDVINAILGKITDAKNAIVESFTGVVDDAGDFVDDSKEFFKGVIGENEAEKKERIKKEKETAASVAVLKHRVEENKRLADMESSGSVVVDTPIQQAMKAMKEADTQAAKESISTMVVAPSITNINNVSGGGGSSFNMGSSSNQEQTHRNVSNQYAMFGA